MIETYELVLSILNGEFIYEIIGHGGGVVLGVGLGTLISLGGGINNFMGQRNQQKNQLKMIQQQMGRFRENIKSSKEYFQKVKGDVKEGADIKEKGIFNQFLDKRASVEDDVSDSITRSGGIISGEVEEDVKEEADSFRREKDLSLESADFEEEQRMFDVDKQSADELAQINDSMRSLKQQEKEISSVSDLDMLFSSFG